MSSNHRQASKIRQKRISGLLSGIFLCLIFLYFAFYTGTYGLVYSNIVTDDFMRCDGEYEIRDLHYNKNTNYLFVLENGDRVVVKPELMQFFDENNLPEKLSVSYSKYKNIFQSAYTAIEIKSDTGTVFLPSESSQKEAQLCMYIGAFFSALSFALIIFCVFLTHTSRKRQKKHRLRP